MKPANFVIIIGRLHPPSLNDLLLGQPSIGVMIPNYVKSGLVSLVETIGNFLILLFRKGKISHLDQGIRLFLCHFTQEGIKPRGPIRNEINMKVRNHAESDRLGKILENISGHG